MTTRYTTRIARRKVTEINSACGAIKAMLAGFVENDKAGTIAMLNSVRPIDVVEYVLARNLTREESNLYLNAISDIPVELQGAYKLGKVWQDLKQTSRKYLQGSLPVTRQDMVKRYRQFIQDLEGNVRVK